MERYKNISGNSNVVAYETGDSQIEVEFQTGPTRFYTYTYFSAGHQNIERMKLLARQGLGLNTFINQQVRKRYASKR